MTPIDKQDSIIKEPGLDWYDRGYYWHKHYCKNCGDSTRYAIRKGVSIPQRMTCDNCEVLT
jgi:hypothetical protein